MVEVVLRVEKGPERGRDFHFRDADNFLVGRAEEAHFRLSEKDLTVSRHHFLLEVRPPNCLIRDCNSTNKTYLRHGSRGDWKVIEEALLKNGDQIRVGETVLSVGMTHPEPSGTIKIKPDPKEKSAEKKASDILRCVRCSDEMDHQPPLGESNLRDLDFMCSKCRSKEKSIRAEKEAYLAGKKYKCKESSCGQDLTELANRDGRAAELADVATYLCTKCAQRSRTLPTHDIGGYLLLSVLGQGGMGVVYKVWHKKTGREAALKEMLPVAKSNEEGTMRFVREILYTQSLAHPHLVRLFEGGIQNVTAERLKEAFPHLYPMFKESKPKEGTFFISELVPNGDLDQFVSDNGEPLLPQKKAARLIQDALAGLSYIHQKGFVHRDIKPGNIMLKKNNGDLFPKLMDFGLMRKYEEHGGTITKVGQFGGSIVFMPKEQITDFKGSKPSVDIYAMGVTLYYLLTGRYPLDFPPSWQLKKWSRQKMEVRLPKDPVQMIMEDTPRQIRDFRKDLSPKLCEAVDKAVRKEASKRFLSAEEFRTALHQAIA